MNDDASWTWIAALRRAAIMLAVMLFASKGRADAAAVILLMGIYTDGWP